MRVYVSLWGEEVIPKHSIPSLFQESSPEPAALLAQRPSSTHWVGICLLNQKCKRPHCLPDFKMEREHQGTSLPSLVPFHPRTSKLLNKIWGPLPSGLCPRPQIHLLGLSLQSFECSHGGFLRWAKQVTWPSDPWLGTYSTELPHLIESSVIP